MSDPKIEPCLFCEIRCFVYDEYFGTARSPAYTIHCSNENCDYRGGRYWGEKAEAIAAHNEIARKVRECDEHKADAETLVGLWEEALEVVGDPSWCSFCQSRLDIVMWCIHPECPGVKAKALLDERRKREEKG